MKHFDEDTILKFVMELLSGEELINVTDHLKGCEICNNKLLSAKKQIELISSYKPEVENDNFPIYKKKNDYSVWLKRAAILLIGFLLGYLTSVILQPNQVAP